MFQALCYVSTQKFDNLNEALQISTSKAPKLCFGSDEFTIINFRRSFRWLCFRATSSHLPADRGRCQKGGCTFGEVLTRWPNFVQHESNKCGHTCSRVSFYNLKGRFPGTPHTRPTYVQIPSIKKKSLLLQRLGDVAQLAQCQPSMDQALESFLSTA